MASNRRRCPKCKRVCEAPPWQDDYVRCFWCARCEEYVVIEVAP